MLASQYYRVTLQLLNTEQLRAQQLSISVATQRTPCACRKSELFFDDDDILLVRTRADQHRTGPAENSYHVFSDHQPVTRRSQFPYAVLARIEINKVKMESVVETLISGNRGQGFRARLQMTGSRKSLILFQLWFLK
jgi:hypothetical protein